MWLTDAVLTQVWEEQLAWRKGRAAFEVAEALAAKVLHGIVAFSQCGSVLQLIEGYFKACNVSMHLQLVHIGEYILLSCISGQFVVDIQRLRPGVVNKPPKRG